MMKAGICGINGRMGRAILNILLQKGHSIGAAFEAETDQNIGRILSQVVSIDNLNVEIAPVNKDDLDNIDGIIDFSRPAGTLKLLDLMKDVRKPIVIGTTGFSDDDKKKIEEASKTIPVLFSPNMSLGVNVLFKLTEIAAKVLSNEFDTEVFEMHHRHKIDAPSGTAKKLLDILKDNSERLKNAPLVYDRSKTEKPRDDNEIGVQVLRGGDIVGEHTVFFTGFGERIELTHRATNREIFARGAVLGLEFLVNRKKPGLYNMYDVLGL